MVGIQIGREQEGERGKDAGFEKIEDFNVTSKAEEKFAQVAAAGDGPDMIFYAHDRFGGFAEAGLLAEIKPSEELKSEIVDFAEQCQAETVVVYHTDPNHARPPLVEELESKGHTVHTPINGESTVLE